MINCAPEPDRRRACHQRRMEVAVAFEELGSRCRLFHQLRAGLYLRERFGRVRGHCQAQEQGLQSFAHQIDLPAFVKIERGHPRAGRCDESDQPGGFEDMQSLSDRQPADTEFLGDLFLPDPGPGKQSALNDA